MHEKKLEIGNGVEDQITITGHKHLAIADDGKARAVLLGGGIVQLHHLAGDFRQVDGAKRPLSCLGPDLRNPRD